MQTGELLRSLQKAKELNPDFAPTRFLLGYMYHIVGRYPEALVEAESLVRLMPRCYDSYSLRGEAWAQLGRAEAFERDFEVALELRPNHAPQYIVKSGCYADLGEWGKAVQALQKAIELDANSWMAHYQLANAYEKMSKYEKVIVSFQRALKLSDRHSTAGHHVEGRIAECRYRMILRP